MAAKGKAAQHRVPFYIGLFCSVVFSLLAWRDPSGLTYGLEHKWGDFLVRVRGDVPGSPKLQIVAIDDFSIAAIGPWPWKRGVHAEIIRKLTKLGVKTIAFDVLFLDDNDADPKGDADLVKATKESGRVIHLFDLATVPILGAKPNYNMPLKGRLNDGAAMMAYPNIGGNLDSDGVMRRAGLYDWSYDDPMALLGVASWIHFAGKTMDDLGPLPDPMTMNYRGAVELPTSVLETSREGVFHFVHAATLFPQNRVSKVDIHDLSKDQLTEQERANFKDGVVFIAATAIGTYDHYPTPVEKSTPGIVIHCNIFDNLLKGDWLVPAPEWAAPAAAFLLAWIASFLALLAPIYASLLLIGVVGAYAGADFLLFQNQLRLAFVVPANSAIICYAACLIHRVWAEGKEKRWIKNTFGQYLSPKVVEALVADPGKLQLGGEKRDMTVMFLDIAHFTNISEALSPEELTAFLNEYLSGLTDVVLKHDGVVDKFIGDCIMAFWNAPMDQPRHRELACLAAVECLDVVQRLNKEFIKPGFPETPQIRVGLNAGQIVVGNMGSRSRFSYTVIGDEVNLASRLEGANKYFGTSVMASEAVVDEGALAKVEAREVGRVRVVGKKIPIRVFELLALKGALPETRKRALDAYNQGIQYYIQRKFDLATDAFKKAAELDPKDKPTQMYLNMCQDYALIPPPDDWDGVFNLTSK